MDPAALIEDLDAIRLLTALLGGMLLAALCALVVGRVFGAPGTRSRFSALFLLFFAVYAFGFFMRFWTVELARGF